MAEASFFNEYEVDPDGLLEYSVLCTDRSLNQLSDKFINTVKYINKTLKHVYNAQTSVLIPGGGSFGMESVARQFCNGQHILVIRNGWFSYRWYATVLSSIAFHEYLYGV